MGPGCPVMVAKPPLAVNRGEKKEAAPSRPSL